MQEILLHICCGVCASSVVERLREQGFRPLGFFYNPNIHPKTEYLKRQEITKQVASILGFELVNTTYDKQDWFLKTKGLEKEPEGGKRCSVCFKMRLEATKLKAQQMHIPKFTTTLTVSPHKNVAVINEIGSSLDPSGFLPEDFKKQDGFRLAMDFAKRYNLYRQNYCGCIYSKQARQKC